MDCVDFDVDLTVNIFEVNIRYLGGLLSVHYLLSEHAPIKMRHLAVAVRDLAVDLGRRLLPAFETPTGAPTNVINLRYGVPIEILTSAPTSSLWESCTACIGTLSLEFNYLSRISGNTKFAAVVSGATRALWSRRSTHNLHGSVLNVKTGQWTATESGIGASHDSYYETMLKTWIAFDDDLGNMFNLSYAALERWCRDNKNRYRIVDMHSPSHIRHSYVDSLGAFWPGLQVCG